MTPDAELLRRYAESRADEAFAELVRRHLNLVYFAALRRTNDATLAEDVAQEVFTVLARQASTLARHATLTGWLYTTTRNTAAKAVRTEQRRKIRELEAQTMNELFHDSGVSADWEKLRPVIDEALDELSGDDREAVLMRCLQNRPFAEIGAALRVSEDAARMRVERALEKLHLLLARRGVTSTASALAAALANQAAAIAPAGLAASVTGAALSGAVAAGASSLAAVFAFMSATKVTLSIAAAGVLAIGAAVYQSSKANAALAAVAEAHRGNAALAARVAELEASINAAEKTRGEREAALKQHRAELAATRAKPTPVDDINARYREVLDKLTRNDVQLGKAQAVNLRARMAEGYRLLFQRLAFTRDQCEQALDILADSAATEAAKLTAIEARFGAETKKRLTDFIRTTYERELVNDVSARLYFLDEPFSAQQVSQLTRIAADASPPERPARGETFESNVAAKDAYRRSLDWEKILAQAETFLSPEQFRGLRNYAAKAQLDMLIATAAKP